MAYMTAAKPAGSILHSLATPFVAFWNVLILIAEAHPKMAEVTKLNETSDTELAARGTSRQQEVRRIFAGRMAL